MNCLMRLVSFVAHARPAARLAAIAVAVAALSGCGGAVGLPDGGSVVRVGERDFKISAPKRVSAGDVTINVVNRGPDAHELIVIRADHGLPMRSDGLTVDEEALEHAEAGALEPAEPGVHHLQVHLTPGRYVLLCNMQGHYLGGMHAVLEVR
jgi:uncharacterized cupredoxin-like copper-binding protein